MSYVDKQESFYRNSINRIDDAPLSLLATPLPNRCFGAPHPIRTLKEYSYQSLHRTFGGVTDSIPRGMLKLIDKGLSPLEVALHYLSRSPLIANTLMEDGQKTFSKMFESSLAVIHFHSFLLNGGYIYQETEDTRKVNSFFKPLDTNVEYKFETKTTTVDGYYVYRGQKEFLIVLTGKPILRATNHFCIFHQGNISEFPLKDELIFLKRFINDTECEIPCLSLRDEFYKRPHVDQMIRAVFNV